MFCPQGGGAYSPALRCVRTVRSERLPRASFRGETEPTSVGMVSPIDRCAPDTIVTKMALYCVAFPKIHDLSVRKT